MPMQLSPAASTLLALAVAGIFALIWGAVVLVRRGNRQKGVLMLICALVLAGNVAIWAA